MNKKKLIFSILFAVIAVAAIVLIVIQLRKPSEKFEVKKIDPAFTQYVAAYSSGLLSSESSIRVRLITDFASENMIGQPISEKIFKFSPSIEGEAYWEDSKTIVFKPKEKLPSGKKYTAKFYLGKIMEVAGNLDVFEFNFHTIAQSFSVFVDRIKPHNKYDLSKQKVLGHVLTADVIDNQQLEQILKATYQNQALKINWFHEADRKMHRFEIDSVQRGEKSGDLKLSWDGKPIKVKLSGDTKVNIPSIHDFVLLSAKVVYNPEQCIALQFSDPILEKLDLKGLITLSNTASLTFAVDDNEVRVFPSSKQTGTMQVTVQSDIRNINDKRLLKTYTEAVTFDEILPAVRLSGKGVILPNSNGLIFPFEAVNLKAVDVKIFKIYEDNITQFLQVNEIAGERELARVGKTVLKKTIPLISPTVTDYSVWNRFYLDLADLIKTEPGAIYQVTLGFKRQHSLYHCPDSEKKDDDDMVSIETELDDEDAYSGYNYYDDYYYDDYSYGDYYYSYNWSDRDNPCTDSYYGKNRQVKRNILASDLGLIAKRGNNGNMVFVVTDLISAQPISGAVVELYDFQKRLIEKLETNADGTASIDLKKKPFLMVAKKDKQRGYLKMEDGNSLSLSMFKVSGDEVQKGLKGFIYTERGVWRPGDSIYLSFILEDKQKTLPTSHPVVCEIVNPRGDLLRTLVQSKSLNGFYDFRTATDANAPTGNYTARIKVGGTTFTRMLKVETIMPNRLKINLDFNTEKLTVKAKDMTGKLQVNWLHGSPARNLRASIDVTYTQAYTSFKNYDEYIFDDPTKKFYTDFQNIFDDNLDESGMAMVRPSLNVGKNAPGAINASFLVRVFEESGAFSVNRFSLPYYPYESFVGIKPPEGAPYSGMLETDKSHAIQIVNITADGKALSGKEVFVEVYKTSWYWWWDASYNSLSSFSYGSSQKPLIKERVKIINGKGTFKLKIDKPDWGNFFVRVTDEQSGHSTGKIIYIDWPDYYSRLAKDESSAATMLIFASDKQVYKPGEKANITIPSSGVGNALVSIESGSKVLQTFWKKLEKEQTVCSFDITKDMAPNIYVHVTLIQPHGQTVNDLPIRMYGVIPIKVDDPLTHLSPVLDLPEVFKPETNSKIVVKEKEGKEMVYTIAIVDEGLLDLTNFITPDPWKHFYAHEALGVKTWDLFDMVMGAYGGQIERILSIGGGDEGEDKSSENANAIRFKPMVRFIGPFKLNKGKTNSHQIAIPQYVGSVRTMIIAGDGTGAYGHFEKTTPVRKPLMLLGTLPRVIGPDETVLLPVTVFAMEPQVKNVNVTIRTNNLFTVVGSKQKSITFKKPGDNVVNFELKVKPELGVGKVMIAAVSGNEKAAHNIEIQVRNPNPPVTSVVDTILNAGNSWKGTYAAIGMKGTNKGVIELSSMPPVNLEKRIRYLLDYPHGCIEQTTSAAFPQLYLSKFMELSDKTKASIDENVKAAIKRLHSFQISGGGFAYWPGMTTVSEWGTNYAGHFMLEAEKAGYAVPSGLKNKWMKHQKKEAQNWSWKGHQTFYNDELIQAYRLYTLALAGQPEMSAMNNLRERKNINNEAKWRLAAAYALAGQTEIAEKIIANATTNVKEYFEMSYTYGSAYRDRAMILETICLIGAKTKGAPLVKQLSDALSSGMWLSTQTTAFSLMAIAKFIGESDSKSGLKCTYSVNGGKTITVDTKVPLHQVQLDFNVKQGSYNIKNLSKGILYARLILQGTPVAGEEVERDNNLRMTVMYKSMNFRAIDVTKITQGTDFIAEIAVTNPGIMGEYREMALSQIFPSGWEIHNIRMDQSASRVKSSYSNYQDIRDDRVYTYFHLSPNETKTYSVMLNAAYVGKYYLPAVHCEAMYDATVFATKTGQWVIVEK